VKQGQDPKSLVPKRGISLCLPRYQKNTHLGNATQVLDSQHRDTPCRVLPTNTWPNNFGGLEPNIFYGRAEMHALLVDKEKALDNLEKAFEVKAFLMAWVKADPSLTACLQSRVIKPSCIRCSCPPTLIESSTTPCGHPIVPPPTRGLQTA
jgi:hypothetical protein